MAIFHHLFSIIRRGGHTCAVATAAYRSGTCLSLRTNKTPNGDMETFTYDYSQKLGINHSEIVYPFVPTFLLPERTKTRQDLWQYVEDFEDQPQDILAFESVFSLPEELSHEQNKALVHDFVENVLSSDGFICDINIHSEHTNNPHVHLMCPPRRLVQTNTIQFGEKLLEEEIRQFSPILEEKFAHYANRHLLKNGFDCKISQTPVVFPAYMKFRPWL